MLAKYGICARNAPVTIRTKIVDGRFLTITNANILLGFKENKPSAPWLLLGLFLKTFFYFSFLFFKALLVLDKLEERRSLPGRAICPAYLYIMLILY